jgi:hypothetical protein
MGITAPPAGFPPPPAGFAPPPPAGFAPPPPGYPQQPTWPGHPATVAAPRTPPPAQAPPRTTGKGWWRRNVWGLVALLPLLALAFGPSVKEGLDYYNRHAHEAVLPGGDGWVTYADARIRLVEFGPATDLETRSGEPFQPPPNTKVWRAAIEFDASSPDAVAGCTLALEDTQGREFSANPVEISGVASLVATCTPKDDGTPSPWQVELYFVTPASAQPEAVRVTRATQLPHYARLPASP